MKVSQKFLDAIYKIDKNNDGVSYQEIKNLDTNNNGKIDKSEANKTGITEQKDIDQINKNVLKYYKGGSDDKGRHAPTEIVFPNPSKPLEIGKFNKEEKGFLHSQFKVPTEEKSNFYQNSMKKADNSILANLSLSTIMKCSEHIKQAGKKYGVDPKLIAAIIFEEQTHQVPPIIEDNFCNVLETIKLKKCESFGLGQLGLDEIKKQNIKLSLGETAKIYLEKPENSINLLAGKLKRLQGLLGYNQNETLTLNNYHETRAIAKIAYLHNGYPDYSKRIIEYMKNPDISNALSPPKLPEPGPKQKTEENIQTKIEANKNIFPEPKPGHRSTNKH